MCIGVRWWTDVCLYIDADVFLIVYMCISTHAQIYTHAGTQTRTHARILTYIHIHHLRMQISICIYAQVICVYAFASVCIWKPVFCYLTFYLC